MHVVDEQMAPHLQRARGVEPIDEDLRERVRAVHEHEIEPIEIERRKHPLGRREVEFDRARGNPVLVAVSADA